MQALFPAKQVNACRASAKLQKPSGAHAPSGPPASIDVRTDVYALGVILYHLLTRKFPYDTNGAAADIAVRIAESDPSSMRTLRRGLDDEIDTVTLKCLAKEPERRYQSAGELARDLGRYLDGEPIQAKPPSLVYFLKKKLRRHRLAAVATMALVLAIAVGVTGTFVGIVWALRERDHAKAETRTAEAQRDRSQHVVRSMKTMLEGVSPLLARGRDDTLLREMLEVSADRLRSDELEAAPQARVEILATIVEVYDHLGDFSKAGELGQLALDLAVAQGAEGDGGRALVLPNLAIACIWGGDASRGGELAAEGAELARRVLSDGGPSE